ncbi:aspartyl-tRNA(Asn)/glutamyl-tRNA(Gln) amidotransferase subunit A [Antricoccus suffuscus]|uniref:Aspartyl-tRNA(Asn)/glutamyl-tRNA(Gln) amidotransferase subunit A n=1 Tax=Antricoccus suffuscus TaxID=1629062 RepID=A0A2T0ZWG8_9ACTN|nr:amidase [Antricoccus suffuscus]PRZ40673.1 aspartyl-tRNA(Asn)/glutamyl-tRNA(Gln) amidotransferase subunit A [Antricoccus suffuscus]
MTDLAYLSVADAGPMLKGGTLSPVQYTEALLARIESLDPQLNSFIRLMREDAMAQARAMEAELRAGRWRGPLHGVPYALKDIVDYAGVPTTAHSKILAGNVATRDATVTARLREAGAICLGKLATWEFALGGPSFDLPWPPARNPWNRDHHPGGSSTGAGAAVAAGFVPFAIGTDTGGSIRNPSTLCGVVGLKPTYGLVSRAGVVPLAYSLDHVGPLARSPRDAALVMTAIAGYDAADPASADVPPRDFTTGLDAGVSGLRIGYVRQFHEVDIPDTDPDVVAGLDAAVETLRAQGADVQDVSMRSLSDYGAVVNIVLLTEAYAVHERWMAERPDDYADLTRQRILPGAFVSGADYVGALRTRAVMVREFAETMRGYDALICASSMDPAAPIDDPGEINRTFSRQARVVFNALGNPALAVPTGFSRTGLPVGMQVVGRPFEDATVLRIGQAYQDATTWHEYRPPLG